MGLRVQINADAKEKILEGVVAFANAYGGRLLLGVAESETRPPCPTSTKL